MLSFNNDPELKKQILNQIQAHHDADEIIKESTGKESKGK
jgi:hypothetical protein